MTYVISSATRNKIVLSLKKEQFIYIKFDTKYSKVNAFNLALLAAASYMEEGGISEFLFSKTKSKERDIGFTKTGNVSSAFLLNTDWSISKIKNTFKFPTVPGMDTQFFHFETEGYFLMSFRGTQEIFDIGVDLYAERIQFAEGAGKVHSGFYRAFKSAQSFIDKVVPSDLGKPIIVCGHSLGGALANLAAAYLRKKNYTKVMLYTYGSPIVGDAEFSHHFTKTQPIISYRFVHNQDGVTMIPPPYSRLRLNILVLGLVNPLFLIPATMDPFGKPFTHFGKMVFIRRIEGEAYSVDVDRKTPAYIRVPSSVSVKEERPLWDELLNWTSVSGGDHLMKNYVSILGSDLNYSIRCYMGAKEVNIENTQKIMAYLESELKLIQASHDELEKKMFISGSGAVFADASNTAATPANKQSSTQKMALLDDALLSKRLELGMQKAALAITRDPGFAQSILKEIVDQKMSPILKHEFDYQATHIKY